MNWSTAILVTCAIWGAMILGKRALDRAYRCHCGACELERARR